MVKIKIQGIINRKKKDKIIKRVPSIAVPTSGWVVIKSSTWSLQFMSQ